MTSFDWMVYGAYGFTGRWIVEEAVARTVEPVLAGRNAARLQEVAEEFGLESTAVSLSDPDELRAALKDVDAVMHAAGPYVETAEPMVEACLDTGTHYVDITGETSVLDDLFALDQRAREAGIVILPGMGFDVVPTDCLASYVATQLNDVDALDLVVKTNIDPTAGTVKSALTQIPSGGQIFRAGQLQHDPLGARSLSVAFPDGQHTGMSAPLGDLVTAAHSTGADSITTYVVLPRILARLLDTLTPLLESLLQINPLRSGIDRLVETVFTGPDRDVKDSVENWIYARARTREEDVAEAWLRVPETYWFTALSCAEVMRALPELDRTGTLSPAMAFGEDFVLRIEGVERFDSL